MDYTKYLREDPWERIKDSLPGKAGDVGRTGDNRRFIEAVMWMVAPAHPGAHCPACTGCGLGSTNGSDGGRKRVSGK